MLRRDVGLHESLVGFDARENWMDIDRLWDTEHKDEFLLKSDVVKPLSADILVWPTIFDVGGCVPLSEQDSSLGEFEGLELSQEVWENYPLYKDWHEIMDIVKKEWRFRNKQVLVVAISCIRDADAPNELPLPWPHLGVLPVADYEKWRFLGYDVGDSGMISGLTGCSYSAPEREEAVRRWFNVLNDHHLFCDEQSAMSFREWTNRRVPEHAPFAVYGLYVVSHVQSSDSGSDSGDSGSDSGSTLDT